MTRISTLAIAAVATLPLLLNGCNSTTTSPATTGSSSTSSTTSASTSSTTTTQSAGQVAATGLQAVTNACTASEPIFAAVPNELPNASASTKATVADIETYYQAACGSVQAIEAVVAADPSGGNNTAAWVAGLSAGILNALPTIGAAIH